MLLTQRTPGSPVDYHKGKKSYKGGLSWHPSGPLSPDEALEAGRAGARRHLRSPPVAVSYHPGVLIPPLAGATAARGTGAPPGGSTHDRSAPPPSRVSAAASI